MSGCHTVCEVIGRTTTTSAIEERNSTKRSTRGVIVIRTSAYASAKRESRIKNFKVSASYEVKKIRCGGTGVVQGKGRLKQAKNS